MGFSWKQLQIEAILAEIRRNKTMSINASNPDFKLRHPDWIRDAQNKNFTQLVKDTTKVMQAKQHLALDRKLKTHGHPKD